MWYGNILQAVYHFPEFVLPNVVVTCRFGYYIRSFRVLQPDMWGPAPAVTPSNYKNNNNSIDTHHDSKATSGQTVGGGNGSKNKNKKKKMQKVDAASLLNFTCSADSGRTNIGEIESLDKQNDHRVESECVNQSAYVQAI